MFSDVPLSALLSWVWTALVIEVDNALEAVTAARVGPYFRVSSSFWLNCLRCIDANGTTVAQLRARSGAECNLGGLERWGWIGIGPRNSGRRRGFGTRRDIELDTPVWLTGAGSYACGVWPGVVDAVGQRWQARFGTDVIDRLSRALDGYRGAWPWSLPEVHPPDGFFSHATETSEADREVPLVGRLGQALTRMTLDLEHDAPVSVPVGANLLRIVGAGTIPTRELPARSGIEREGITMATNFAVRRGFAETVPARHVRLTPSGLAALEDHRTRADRNVDPALRAALVGLLGRHDELAEGLQPPAAGWRAQKPYRTRTQRFLADPTGALPWQPMVLHRGGWPDGS